MSYWDGLDPKYSVILCDIWGVVHDGVSLYPNAAKRLREWREQGRKVTVLVVAGVLVAHLFDLLTQTLQFLGTDLDFPLLVPDALPVGSGHGLSLVGHRVGC